MSTPDKARVQALLKAPYTRVFVRDEDGTYGTWVLEWPGCYSGGVTAEEAMANLDEAMELWATIMLEDGREIPEPWDPDEYSGRVTLRILPSLHERAASLAALEGVSLNRFLATAIAHYTGYREATAAGSEPVRARRVSEPGADTEYTADA